MGNNGHKGSGGSYTGLSRKRATSPAVKMADVLARWTITAGGIGTILAVATVCLFLLAVAWPLFESTRATPLDAVPRASGPTLPLHVGMDPHQILGWALEEDGTLRGFPLAGGKELFKERLFKGPAISAASFSIDGSTAALGFRDGSIAFVRFQLVTRFLPLKGLPEKLGKLTPGSVARYHWTILISDPDGEEQELPVKGLVQMTPARQLRAVTIRAEIELKKRAGRGPVTLIDHILNGDQSPLIAVWMPRESKHRRLRLFPSKLRQNMVTGKSVLRFARPLELPFKNLAPESPAFLRLAAEGSNIYLAWHNGRAERIARIRRRKAILAEDVSLVTRPGVQLSALDFVLGRESLVAGDSKGGLAVWDAVNEERLDEGFLRFNLGKELWVFHKGSSKLARFKQQGRLAGAARKLKGYRGLLDLYAPDQATLNDFLAATRPDGLRLVRIKTLKAEHAGVTALKASPRSRLVAVGFEDGQAAIYQVTSGFQAVKVSCGRTTPIKQVLLGEKEDGLLAVAAPGLFRWSLKLAHPDVTLSSLFGKVTYEGYGKPQHMWQSSASSDSFEPKLGLMPLVFGTFKATLYTMLFGAPLALLAALYSSEFLDKKRKARIKPVIELMASLPSVVLGFLAAQIFAPVVAKHLAGVLCLFVTIPATFMLGAHLFELLPPDRANRLRSWRFPIMLFVCLPLGTLLGLLLVGPGLERFAFGGDLLGYLDGAHAIPTRGSPQGAWLILLFPLSVLLSLFLSGRLSCLVSRRAGPLTRKAAARRSLGKFLFQLVLVLGLGVGLASLASLFGDARGPEALMDTYVQRNALVVGFVMGFAVIPIIYTIADDALSAVPAHLRAASLGAGATRWQTTLRIVIPTAMSGLFSACMIGLGRAVGETMIVLMAAGNTPIMQINIFNGFRTLSANIATELPEAVQQSSHYRTLFLAALVLFAMTFILNTIAEAVRLRFRKRSLGL